MDRKIEILTAHGIDWSFDGRLFAFESATRRIADYVADSSQWIDVTDWSIKEVYFWLGY